jgi:hypothetical protein
MIDRVVILNFLFHFLDIIEHQLHYLRPFQVVPLGEDEAPSTILYDGLAFSRTGPDFRVTSDAKPAVDTNRPQPHGVFGIQ